MQPMEVEYKVFTLLTPDDTPTPANSIPSHLLCLVQGYCGELDHINGGKSNRLSSELLKRSRKGRDLNQLTVGAPVLWTVCLLNSKGNCLPVRSLLNPQYSLAEEAYQWKY